MIPIKEAIVDILTGFGIKKKEKEEIPKEEKTDKVASEVLSKGKAPSANIEITASGYFPPIRRYPPPSSHDTAIAANNRTLADYELNPQFIDDKEIKKVFPIKFSEVPLFFKERIDSNKNALEDIKTNQSTFFSAALLEGLTKDMLEIINKSEKVIGRTPEGKHVILQQAARACVPATLAMLILDRGATPDYFPLVSTNLADDSHAQKYLEAAGFQAQIQALPDDPAERISFLVDCLNRRGPGSLGISAPGIGGHQIVLDAISLSEKTVTIRDPFHGWMVTVDLDKLLEWTKGPGTFIQIK